jgi:ABC-type phosphonate transport system ATPase subunit
MNLLEVRNVTKSFGSLIAVSGVSLNVEPGELRAVIERVRHAPPPDGSPEESALLTNFVSCMRSPEGTCPRDPPV